jgi:hypothetical protein
VGMLPAVATSWTQTFTFTAAGQHVNGWPTCYVFHPGLIWVPTVVRHAGRLVLVRAGLTLGVYAHTALLCFFA